MTFQNKIFQAIPTLNELCECEIKSNPQRGVLMLFLRPNNEYGQEEICILAYEDHIILSYDCYEIRFDFNRDSSEKTFEQVFIIIKKIFREQLVAVTTYSSNLNATRVSNLYSPDEAKKIKRRKNFRARSWLGTYDDDCT